jgi:hypothetical protein
MPGKVAVEAGTLDTMDGLRPKTEITSSSFARSELRPVQCIEQCGPIGMRTEWWNEGHLLFEAASEPDS